jgi:hypothetical protein
MSQFAVSVAKFVEKAKSAPEIVVRKVSMDLFTRIVMRTPVGNPTLWKSSPPAGYVGGRARASWRIGINQFEWVMDVRFDENGAATIAYAHVELARWKPDDTIYIGSRLPYIRPLEYGHSRQAPAGMVRLAVAEWRDFLKQAVDELPR